MTETAAELMAHPWAMEPNALAAVAESLAAVRAGKTPPQAAARPAPGRGRKPPAGDGVAYVPLIGPMVQRGGWLAELLGFTSAEAVGQMLDAAAADPRIGTVLLEVDSPGGSVFGTAELAAKVAALAKQKKVTAVVNSMAASAAYWVASQATEIVVTPGGMVGSIGAYLMHVDQSGALANDGLKVTLISAGENKTAGNSFEPLSDAGRRQMVEQVQAYYQAFTAAVAAGRRVSPGEVKAGFGRGGMVLAADAVRAGMADRVAAFDSVAAGYGLSLSGHPPLAGVVTAPPVASAKPACHAVEVRKRRLLLDGDHSPPAKTAAPTAPPRPAPPVADSRTPAEVYATAVHEAGHGLVGHLLGGTVEELSVERNPDAGSVGHARITGLGRADRLVMLAAGWAAASALCPEQSARYDRARGDRELAGADGFTEAEWRSAGGTAAGMIREKLPTLEHLARRLVKARTMTRADFLAAAR